MKKFLSILFRKTSHKPSAEGNSAKTTKTKINVPSDIMHRELENKSLLTFHESEIASKARVFFNLVFGTASILTITQTIVCFIIPQNLIRWVTIIIIFNIACAGLLYLNKKKNTSVASFIFIGFLLFFIFGLAWTAGGIKSQAIQAIPLVILVAGLLLGWKVGLLSGLISILGGLGLILAEYQGILPINTVIHSSLSSWINLVMLVSLLALLQFLSVSGLDKSLSNARKELSLRIKAEEKLNYSEVLYRSIFENANDAIFIMKEDRFIECNRKTLEIFGCTREQIINNTPYSYSPRHQPDGKLSEEKALVYINESLKGSPQRFEWQHCQYDKTVFDAEVSLNKIESNNEILLQAIVRDVTERKRPRK